MRRLLTLTLILLIVAAAWSGAWFWLASWVERNTSSALASIKERGIDVECSERSVIGFPFAVRLDCGETVVRESRSGTNAQLGGLTGGASVFAPRTAEIALASPARIESPLLAGPADLSWNDAAIGVGMGLNGPRAISFDATDLQGQVPLPAAPGARMKADAAEGTLVPADDGGTLADFTFTGLSIDTAAATLPPVDGRASAHLSIPPRALLSGRAGLQAPISARDIDVVLALGDAKIAAAGELSVDAEGLLDGTVSLILAGKDALAQIMATLPAEHQKYGNAIAGGMLAFGKPTTLEGEAATELVLDIERGAAKIGPLSITLPRLPL